MASRTEYNKNRRLHLLNLPPSTEGEIKEFLGGIKVKNVELNTDLDAAIVNVVLGSQVDEAVSKYNGKQFKDNVVVVKPAASKKLMCVAHFPLSYSDAQFKDLCKKKGPINYAYIMKTDNGFNKGYGLVEFDCDLEQAKLFKSQLDWMEIDGHILHADFLEESVQASYEELRSRCLFVTGMPENFIDITKMRELFGCVTSPVYCQIVAKDEKSLGYGIVEFKTADEAESTWLKMKDDKIEGNDVQITFCIPGKSAVVVNNRVVWKFADKLKKSSLLPDPVNAKPVIGGNPIYISLIKSNPKLGAEFTAVLAELQQAYVTQKMSPADKPGLLGPAPSLPLSPVMNPNMQLGLIVMLAVAVQKAKKEVFCGVLSKQLNTLSELDGGPTPGPKPSILGDPITGQANVILTSLRQQLDEIPLKGDNGVDIAEPTQLEEKLKFIFKKYRTNGRHLNCTQLANLGQLLVAMNQMALDVPARPPGSGLLSTPSMGPPGGGLGGKGASLLGPVPGLNPLMGNNMNEPVKGSSLLGDAPNMPGKAPSLMGAGPSSKQQQQQANALNNQAIVQAMGLGIGASGMNNLSQTLLGQISQGLVHQIGQNLMYQLSVNQGGSSPNMPGGGGGGGAGSGKGLLGDIPNAQGSSMGGGGRNKPSGKSSLLGEPPSQYKSNQGGTTSLDQGSWKAGDGRWGPAGGYESGYSSKSGMGGGGGYNDFGGYGDSYAQDMSGGYGAGYGGTTGGFGDGDFYNSYQQYASNFGSGSGFGGGTGSMGGANSSNNYGMGGGLGGNQASGVNFQDGFGKSASNTGLGQDSSRFVGGDGFGGNMGGVGGAGGVMGYGGYGMRDDMTDSSNYESYGSTGMGNSFGGGGGMGGLNDMGMSSSSSGMGMGGMAGMAGMSASGMNTMGMGGGFGGSGGGGGAGTSQMGAYSTGISSFGGSGMGSNSGNSLLGSGGLLDNMGSVGGSFGGGSGSMSSLMGNGFGGSFGNKSSLSGFGGRDQSQLGNSSYFTSGGGGAGGGGGGSSSSGLLPSPAGKFNMNPPGQKRPYSQLLSKSDSSSATQDYMSQLSQGMGGGLYADSFKRSRLY